MLPVRRGKFIPASPRGRRGRNFMHEGIRMRSHQPVRFLAMMILAVWLQLGCALRVAEADVRTEALAARLDEVLGRGATGSAHYAARVIDLQTGKELYAVNIDEPIIPASNGKLAVSAAALDFFGAVV